MLLIWQQKIPSAKKQTRAGVKKLNAAIETLPVSDIKQRSGAGAARLLRNIQLPRKQMQEQFVGESPLCMTTAAGLSASIQELLSSPPGTKQNIGG